MIDGLDCSRTKRIPLKAGASNLLKNEHIETYGGPTVGRLAYISFAMDL